MVKRVDSYKLALAAEQKVKERDYWLNKLSGDLVKSSFPYDFQDQYKNNMQESVQSAMRTETFRFSETFYIEAMKLSKGKNIDVKLHMILVTVLFILLNRYRGAGDSDSDIMIGSPLLKQQGEGEVEFINTLLVFKNNVDGHVSFKDLLLQVRETIIEANKNQNYPMERLLGRLNIPVSGNEFPLFDVVILLENLYDKHFIEDIHYNMGFSFLRTAGSIEGLVEYNPLLYREATIRQIIRHYLHILGKVLDDVNVRLSGIQLLSREERKQVLMDFNRTRVDYPGGKTLHQIFELQVNQTPKNVALLGQNLNNGNKRVAGAGDRYRRENVSITYNQLDRQSDLLARLLRNKGIQADTIVGLMIEPSIGMMISILGILKAGGAYMPIDPDYPEERRRYMINDSRTEIVLTWQEIAPAFSPEAFNNYPQDTFSHLPQASAPDNSLAYVIYTSGSTGKPKGVLVEHGNVVAYMHAFFNEFEIGPADTAIQLTTYAFDIFVESAFPVLLKGGTLLIPGYADLVDMRVLYDMMVKHHVSIIDCTPLQLNEFNRIIRGEPNSNLFRVVPLIISGGDVLKKEYVDCFMEIGKVYNTYGPTETTICATYCRLTSKENQPGIPVNIPIGKPVANYKIYILDDNSQPVPIGVTGQLFVSGPGVTRGYQNSPGLTLERFVNYKLQKEPPGRRKQTIYKTGDLARWLPDGNIEFLGRLDQQIKIRGYRIETGEIEHRLMKMEDIYEAVVIAREDKQEEKYLCAYIVSDRELNVSELRDSLELELPYYMIPSFFVKQDKIPLTPNGKIDVRALPLPSLNLGEGENEYIAPRDQMERKLVEIWSGVLGVEKDKISITANFFQLGGHSLRGISMLSRVHKELNVKIHLAELFRTPTIKELAESINVSEIYGFTSIQPVEEKEYYALSSAQKRLYSQYYMEPHSVSYNVPVVVRLGGKLDKERLKKAFADLINRHEILRTSFRMIEEQPVQRVLKDVEFSPDMARDYKPGEEVEVEAEELIKNFIRPFDLNQAPLLRVRLVRVKDSQYLLMTDIHHIITDGTSMGILIQEIMNLYEGRALRPLSIRYRDFSSWQNREKQEGTIKKQEEYWLKEFSGPIPKLNLPTDYVRPSVQDYEGDRINFQLDIEETTFLNKTALKEGTTLYMLLLGLFNILLSRACDQEDIVVGTPTANRRHPDLELIIGFFVNMLPIRNYPTGEKTFREFLHQVKERTLLAYDNQDYQFEDLVERVLQGREAGHHSLVDVLVVLQNIDVLEGNIPEVRAPDLNLIPVQYTKRTSPFDIIFLSYEAGERLAFSFIYKTKLFKEETIRMLEKNFKEVVSAIMNDPDIRLKNIAVSHDLLSVKPGTQQEDQGDFDFF